ncbi:diphthamide biosynthesis protein [Marasmius fiardii PR-910]|nr:diphthamide biosynthesis protein [Marasmius fiardii PR-910]
MTAENTAFSTSGEEVIHRKIDVQIDETADRLSGEGFDDFYEIDRTAKAIEDGDYRRTALQFPDELLHDSVTIFSKLKRKIGSHRELYVLADTSYGRQALVIVAAQHVDADAMVHYGYACMSQTYRLPVFYVFGKRALNVDDCINKFFDVLSSHEHENSLRKTVVLRHDVVYAHLAENVLDKLRNRAEPLGVNIIYSKVPDKLMPTDQTSRSQPLHESRRISEDHALKCTILYVGEESLGLTNLLMTHSDCDVFSYSPSQKICELQSTRTNKMLMRRYAVVQKARDADVFGILVGTLGVASYLPLIKHLRAKLSTARKKAYTISVGKLNPAKLANFMEIECFILVACPENSLIDAKEFYRPIVTPYELEVALQPETQWTGRYVFDFEKLLAENTSTTEGENHSDEKTSDNEDDDRPMFSLVTGKYRHARRFGGSIEPDNDTSSALVSRKNQNGTLIKVSDDAAGQFLQSRSFQGLEMRLGEDAPSVLEQGRSGIARGYGEA